MAPDPSASAAGTASSNGPMVRRLGLGRSSVGQAVQEWVNGAVVLGHPPDLGRLPVPDVEGLGAGRGWSPADPAVAAAVQRQGRATQPHHQPGGGPTPASTPATRPDLTRSPDGSTPTTTIAPTPRSEVAAHANPQQPPQEPHLARSRDRQHRRCVTAGSAAPPGSALGRGRSSTRGRTASSLDQWVVRPSGYQ
jgi:hypothetical protein